LSDSQEDSQKNGIEAAPKRGLDASGEHAATTLADLYDPPAMPSDLLKAHQSLDRAVDAAYGKKAFKSDAERVAFLFERYQALTSLLPANKGKTAPRAKKADA